jgi:hypothetical protein
MANAKDQRDEANGGDLLTDAGSQEACERSATAGACRRDAPRSTCLAVVRVPDDRLRRHVRTGCATVSPTGVTPKYTRLGRPMRNADSRTFILSFLLAITTLPASPAWAQRPHLAAPARPHATLRPFQSDAELLSYFQTVAQEQVRERQRQAAARCGRDLPPPRTRRLAATGPASAVIRGRVTDEHGDPPSEPRCRSAALGIGTTSTRRALPPPRPGGSRWQPAASRCRRGRSATSPPSAPWTEAARLRWSSTSESAAASWRWRASP